MNRGTRSGGRSTAAGRLVARSQRPALRASEDFHGPHVVETGEALPAVPPGPVARREVTEPPASVSPFVHSDPPRSEHAIPEPSVAPVVRAGRSRDAPQAATPTALGPPTEVSPKRQPPVLEAPVPPTVVVPATEVSAAAAVPGSEDPVTAPGWQVFAEPEPVASSRTTASDSVVVAPEQVPASGARPRAAEAELAFSLSPASTSAPVAQLPAAPPPARPPDASSSVLSAPMPAASAPPTAELPRLMIDRIDVITSPAPAAPSDPFASLAPRRAGASRHGPPR